MTTLDPTRHDTLPATAPETDDEERIAGWLRKYIADLLAIPEEKVGLDVAFHRIGLDSSAAVAMTGDLGDWLGCEIDAAAAYEYPTILKLSRTVMLERRRTGHGA